MIDSIEIIKVGDLVIDLLVAHVFLVSAVCIIVKLIGGNVEHLDDGIQMLLGDGSRLLRIRHFGRAAGKQQSSSQHQNEQRSKFFHKFYLFDMRF